MYGSENVKSDITKRLLFCFILCACSLLKLLRERKSDIKSHAEVGISVLNNP
jgi:hypothetical protein